MLKQQKGKCLACGLHFLEWDVMEVDHKIPRAIGGKDEWNNLQLLHRHCHDEKTAQDLIEIWKKEHSKFLKKLAQEWSRYEWEWIDDIPTIKTQAVKKSCSDKRKHIEYPCAGKLASTVSDGRERLVITSLDPTGWLQNH
ncbi:HNH endonuclease [Microseira sp. BLCC-F43]